MSRAMRFGLAGLTAVSLVGGASLAVASPSFGREIIAEGHCSYGSVYHQAMEPDIGVEMEVGAETGVPDQEWKVEMYYNGTVVFRGIEHTEEDGGFEVKMQPRNLPGDDHFSFRLTNRVTKEICEGSLTAPL